MNYVMPSCWKKNNVFLIIRTATCSWNYMVIFRFLVGFFSNRMILKPFDCSIISISICKHKYLKIYLHLEVWVGGICGSCPRTVLRPTDFESVAYAHSAKMPHGNIIPLARRAKLELALAVLQTAVLSVSPRMLGAGRRIWTFGTFWHVQGFSKPSLSATQPSQRFGREVIGRGIWTPERFIIAVIAFRVRLFQPDSHIPPGCCCSSWTNL